MIHCVNPACELAFMSSWTPTTYKTRTWAEYNLSLKQQGSLAIWFDPEMVWDAAPSDRRGLQRRGDTGLSEAQSGVWLAVEADGRLCSQSTQACRVRLACSRLQHPAPATTNLVRRHPLQGLNGAIALVDR